MQIGFKSTGFTYICHYSMDVLAFLQFLKQASLTALYSDLGVKQAFVSLAVRYHISSMRA